MHDVFSVRIPEGICNKADRSQHKIELFAGEHTDVRPTDVLKAEKRLVRVVMVFEYSDNVGMHQPRAELPFRAQEFAIRGIARECGG